MAHSFSTRKLSEIALAGAAFVALAASASAQSVSPASSGAGAPPVVQGMTERKNFAPGTMIIPESNKLLATDTKKVRTHLRMMVVQQPPTKADAIAPGGVARAYAPPAPGYFYETPASVQCIYGLVAPSSVGCNPNQATAHLTTGGSRAIAIVDAYHHPNARSDLAVFSAQFGLPAPSAANFQVVYATGVQPPDGTGSGWDIEVALDTQWARAMAPNAFIYLVEAMSNSVADMNAAVDKASQLVAAKGGGQVSMSYGRSEEPGDPAMNSHFATPKVVYFASSGDAPGVQWPCASANVVCVGGTSVSRAQVTGRFQGEVAWSETGGGVSAYHARPAFQNGIYGIVGSKRGVPDVAAVADPYTGAWVYNLVNGGWFVVGGTSLSAPLMAGYVNFKGSFYASSLVQNTVIYSAVGAAPTGWTDIVSGACNFWRSSMAVAGWDACTGRGSPTGLASR